MDESKDDLDERMRLHYEKEQREEERLGLGAGRLEFVRTMEILERFLPRPPARVLDIGAGTGAYALPLAERGYSVHLVEPIERHLRVARAAAEERGVAFAAVEKGDARRLTVEDESADGVLLLGPLYHLTTKEERATALREAHRVLKSGGVAFVAAISRFASTYDALMRGFIDEPEFEAIMERDVAEGQHRNPASRPDWFTTAYFHRPDELLQEMGDAGFMDAQLFAVEGPGWVVPNLDEVLDDADRRERLLRSIRRVEQEPSILGASAHVLGVGRRA